MAVKKIITTILARRFSITFLAIWSCLILLSYTWNIHENYRGLYSKALVEAKTIFQHNLAYRRWNSMFGGVYAPVTAVNTPNPYVVGPQRDLMTMEGVQLTMINPFRMTKQAYDLMKLHSPELAVLNRTVSLNPLNSDNFPDEWERKALIAFEEGKGEVSEITTIEGHPYLRLLSPYVTEERCLKCHAHQGYDIGDVRGGMSIAVPMQPYYDAAESSRRIIGTTHLIIWLLGSMAIMLFSNGLRRYKAAIAKNEEKFRIVSEFAYNFEYWIDKEKKLAFISPSCERITGYSRREFEKHSKLLFEIIHPDDREAFKGHLEEFDEPVHDDIEYRIITKSGQERWLSHTCIPIYAEGEFLGRRGSNRDITDKKRLEEELIQAKKVECLGHFAGGVAHDFNNVLSSIATFTHLLLDEVDENNESAQDYINHIIIAAKLGRNLTSNLLSFGRKQIVRRREARLNAIITNIERLLRTLLHEDIELTVELTDTEAPVFVDAHQIEQILINLSTNARDAMPDGGVLKIASSLMLLDRPVEGSFGEIPAGSFMVLSVSDSGFGIPEQHLAGIFAPFYTTKDSCKGTGLGLSIIDNIVKEHEAYISVESRLNEGTTFSIYFRTVGDQVAAVADEAPKAEHPPGILLVDDDELIRKALKIFLENRGYNVFVAEDGDEALRQYVANRDEISLAILDVMLPKRNGREVFDSLRADNPNIKVLFVSGFTNDILTEQGIEAENLEFLHKPLDMELFSEKVKELVTEERKG